MHEAPPVFETGGSPLSLHLPWRRAEVSILRRCRAPTRFQRVPRPYAVHSPLSRMLVSLEPHDPMNIHGRETETYAQSPPVECLMHFAPAPFSPLSARLTFADQPWSLRMRAPYRLPVILSAIARRCSGVNFRRRSAATTLAVCSTLICHDLRAMEIRAHDSTERFRPFMEVRIRCRVSSVCRLPLSPPPPSVQFTNSKPSARRTAIQ